MSVDFLANDFGAIARAMRRGTPTARKVVLYFWVLASLLTSEHESVEAAVADAYNHLVGRTAKPDSITAADGTVLLDREALADAVMQYQDGLPI